MITKIKLDELAKKFDTIDFIQNDPVQFPHRGQSLQAIEILGFIASLFAYGNRKIFINKINEIIQKTDNDIVNYIKNGDFYNLKNIEYRFAKDIDIISIFQILSKLYNSSKGLSELFRYGFSIENNIKIMLQSVVDYFYANNINNVGQGFYHMIPNPSNGGAMKRMNMYLRWMVRKSEVDLGIWDFIKPKNLLIPLDVHVARISREMQLLNRKSNDFKSVLELTNQLKIFCPEDPVKYDFALFGYGIELNNKGEK